MVRVTAGFFQNYLIQKILSGIPSECESVWIQIRPHILSDLIWVQNVGKDYRQMTPAGKELIQLDTWVKVFRINPDFRILRPTFHRKPASKY